MKLWVKIVVPALCVFMGACATDLKPVKTVSIQSDFIPFVEQFKVDAAYEGVNVTIDNLIIKYADDMDQYTIGECSYSDSRYVTPVIRINRSDWAIETEVLKQVIIYHEMGHCVLMRDHDETWIIDGADTIVNSIMHPYLQDEYMYYMHWEHYRHELFHPNN